MNQLEKILKNHQNEFYKIVDFDITNDKLLQLDFSANNIELNNINISNTEEFSKYIDNKLRENSCKYGVGGYNEDRILYKRSGLFDGDEPRTIHLGIDIWGNAGTRIYAPLGGMTHSFGFHNDFGNYGVTIILLHQLETVAFYTLYGHLSLENLDQMQEGKYVSRGEIIGHFGKPSENGNWPPHLHFQIIQDMQLKEGDYPGVCKTSERNKYLDNCPDPNLILGMMQYAK